MSVIKKSAVVTFSNRRRMSRNGEAAAAVACNPSRMSRTDELIDALSNGDAARTAALLDEDPSLLGAKSGAVSAVLLALYHGHPSLAQLFTARGAVLTFPELCALGVGERVRRMLEEDRSLASSYSEDGYPALGLAIFFRQPGIARLLIEQGADVDAAAKNPQAVAPLHAAAAVQDHETMRLLLDRRADPNARQQAGFTAFHSAAGRGDIEMAKLLLAHGADVRATTDEGKSAVEIAEEHGKPEFAAWLRGLTPRG